MTKNKVIQIGLIISLLAILLYKIFPSSFFSELNTSSISNVILFSIIFMWVSSYLLRVVNGKMTFMEQRKRYRQKYDKLIDDKLKKEFNSMTTEEQDNLLKDIEDN